MNLTTKGEWVTQNFFKNKATGNAAGIDGREKPMIDKNSIQSFQKLVACIAKKVGGKGKAYEVIGVSRTAIYCMRQGKLSKDTAKKILSAYHLYCKT